jgi:hypothetical protein
MCTSISVYRVLYTTLLRTANLWKDFLARAFVRARNEYSLEKFVFYLGFSCVECLGSHVQVKQCMRQVFCAHALLAILAHASHCLISFIVARLKTPADW